MATTPSSGPSEDVPTPPINQDPTPDFSSSSPDAETPPATGHPPVLFNVPQPSVHIARPDPATRQNGSTNWSHGVLSGGRLIDILECLTKTLNTKDWSIALWLQEHYIAPFGRVDRLDGLVVTHADDVPMIKLAYGRFVELEGLRSIVQKLWVPGLEPAYLVTVENEDAVKIPALPKRYVHAVWRGSNMYYRNDREVAKKGVNMGYWKDEAGWGRMIWRVPDQNG